MKTYSLIFLTSMSISLFSNAAMALESLAPPLRLANSQALPPPSTIPTGCDDSAQTSISAWAADYNQLQALPPSLSQATAANCTTDGTTDGKSLIEIGSFQDGGGLCTSNGGTSPDAAALGYLCLPTEKYNAAVTKYSNCVTAFQTQNGAQYAVSDKQRAAVIYRIGQDRKNFISACHGVELVHHNNSAVDPCSQIPNLRAQLGKDKMWGSDSPNVSSDQQALDAATNACNAKTAMNSNAVQTTQRGSSSVAPTSRSRSLAGRSAGAAR